MSASASGRELARHGSVLALPSSLSLSLDRNFRGNWRKVGQHRPSLDPATIEAGMPVVQPERWVTGRHQDAICRGLSSRDVPRESGRLSSGDERRGRRYPAGPAGVK